MKGRWGRLKRWQKWTFGGLAALLLLIVLAGVFGEDTESGADEAARPSDTPAVSTAAPAPPAPEPAEPVDTGRMSEGEYDQARDTVIDLRGEIRDYRGRVAERCSVLLRGGEIQNTLDCIEEAYDGVPGQAGLTHSILEELRGDVGGRCLRSVTTLANITNRPLYQALEASKGALDTLDADVAQIGISRLNGQQERWEKASGDMLQLCSPAG